MRSRYPTSKPNAIVQIYSYYILITIMRQPWIWYAILPIRTQTFVLDLR